jgi:hypothetical protein
MYVDHRHRARPTHAHAYTPCQCHTDLYTHGHWTESLSIIMVIITQDTSHSAAWGEQVSRRTWTHRRRRATRHRHRHREAQTDTPRTCLGVDLRIFPGPMELEDFALEQTVAVAHSRGRGCPRLRLCIHRTRTRKHHDGHMTGVTLADAPVCCGAVPAGASAVLALPTSFFFCATPERSAPRAPVVAT